MHRTREKAAMRQIVLYGPTSKLSPGAFLGNAYIWKDRRGRYYLGRCDDSLQLAQRVETINTVGAYVVLVLAASELLLTPAMVWQAAIAGLP